MTRQDPQREEQEVLRGMDAAASILNSRLGGSWSAVEDVASDRAFGGGQPRYVQLRGELGAVGASVWVLSKYELRITMHVPQTGQEIGLEIGAEDLRDLPEVAAGLTMGAYELRDRRALLSLSNGKVWRFDVFD